MEEEIGYDDQVFGEANFKIRDLEEKQRILKDRLILVSQNLIDLKEQTTEKTLEIKKDIETIKQSLDRMKAFLETISSEFSRFARKEDLEILSRQAKMFQPLKLANKK